jgi:hypothetical protein
MQQQAALGLRLINPWLRKNRRGITRSGKSYSRSNRRPATVTSPAANNHSNACFSALQSHHGPARSSRVDRLPAPSAPCALDRRQNAADDVGLLTAKTRQLLIDVPPRLSLHAPAHQRVQLQRQQRGLMAPIFEQPTPATPGELVEHVASVVSRRENSGR